VRNVVAVEGPESEGVKTLGVCDKAREEVLLLVDKDSRAVVFPLLLREAEALPFVTDCLLVGADVEGESS
jgi:hypothetical protein